MNIKVVFRSFTIIWCLIVFSSFFYNFINIRHDQERGARESARSFFDQVVLTRKWNAMYGGVYVPANSSTQPSPYLKEEDRAIRVNDDLTLVKINPAYMTRQLSELADLQEGIQFHITSRKPLRPGNKPTPREDSFLKIFEKGDVGEIGFFEEQSGNSRYFYMAPLIVEQSCMGCHAEQGYRVGDIRGGISVTLPRTAKSSMFPLVVGHSVIGIFGIVGITMFGGRLQRAYDIIKTQAVFDTLTGIPNRRCFSESILKEYKRSLREHEPLAVIMCDIDNFKVYNDTYGHVMGDECLRSVAQHIEKSLRRPADFCARYGGEEFVVVLPNTDINGALEVAEKIRSSIEDLHIPHAASLPAQIVTISGGVAACGGSPNYSHEELVNHADRALYRAKETGRNRIEVYSREIIKKAI